MTSPCRRFAPAALTAAAALVVSLGACGEAGPPPAGAAPASESSPSPAPFTTTTSLRPPLPSAATSATPSPPPEPTAQGPRPSNGQIFVRQQNGEGELVVENGTAHDSYVTLAAGRVAVSTVYVRAQEATRIRGIADGDYTVYFVSGTGWNSDLRRFTANVQAQQFEDTFAYITSPISSTEWTVTLHPVEGGTAYTTSVSPEAIPR